MRKRPSDSPRSAAQRELDVVYEVFGAPAIITPPGGKPIKTRVVFPPRVRYSIPDGAGLFEEHAAGARWRFEHHRDPIAPWQVYYAARALGRSVPDWVGRYLDRAAHQIVIAGHGAWQNPAPMAAAASAALGFKSKGAGSVFARAAKAHRDEELALLVLTNVRQGRQVKAVIFDVAKARRVSSSTVERAWQALPKSVKAGALSAKPHESP